MPCFDAVLEGFAAVDEDHWDFNVVFLLEFGVGVDVYFPPLECGFSLKRGYGVFRHIAEVTAFARIDDHFMHELHCSGGLKLPPKWLTFGNLLESLSNFRCMFRLAFGGW